ncbi:hypothetical protein RJT03_02485 [Bacteroides thetaiotaomicron]|nr:hypothetical protein [Bacteroides thetaiotaomicron]WOG43312.1 hypothetical protein RJT03_02485 [Bacteroides thetaiotaomicron]
MSLIKDLLAGRLTKKQRRSYADLESVDRELKYNGMNQKIKL